MYKKRPLRLTVSLNKCSYIDRLSTINYCIQKGPQLHFVRYHVDILFCLTIFIVSVIYDIASYRYIIKQQHTVMHDNLFLIFYSRIT